MASKELARNDLKQRVRRLQWELYHQYNKHKDLVVDKDLPIGAKLCQCVDTMKNIRVLKHDIRYLEKMIKKIQI